MTQSENKLESSSAVRLKTQSGIYRCCKNAKDLVIFFSFQSFVHLVFAGFEMTSASKVGHIFTQVCHFCPILDVSYFKVYNAGVPKNIMPTRSSRRDIAWKLDQFVISKNESLLLNAVDCCRKMCPFYFLGRQCLQQNR